MILIVRIAFSPLRSFSTRPASRNSEGLHAAPDGPDRGWSEPGEICYPTRMSIKRAFVSILSDSLPETRDFYTSLFEWRVDFDSDWFVHLQAPENAAVELGIIRRNHEIVPVTGARAPEGVLLTIVVEDVDALHALCRARSVEIVEPPRNLFYGQRRMVIRDPNGTLVDVSSECEPDPAFLASLGGS